MTTSHLVISELSSFLMIGMYQKSLLCPVSKRPTFSDVQYINHLNHPPGPKHVLPVEPAHPSSKSINFTQLSLCTRFGELLLEQWTRHAWEA